MDLEIEVSLGLDVFGKEELEKFLRWGVWWFEVFFVGECLLF